MTIKIKPTRFKVACALDSNHTVSKRRKRGDYVRSNNSEIELWEKRYELYNRTYIERRAAYNE